MRLFLSISKALAEEARVRALVALRDGELCLCQIIDLLRPLAPSTVSKHMTILMQAGLVERRKQGRWHYYRLADEGAAPEIRRALGWALAAVGQDPVIVRDAGALRRLRRKDLEELSTCYRS